MKLLNKTAVTILVALLLLPACAAYLAAGDLSGGSVTPGRATANSIFTFQVRWTDSDGRWPVWHTISANGVAVDTSADPESPSYTRLDVELEEALPIAPYIMGGENEKAAIRVIRVMEGSTNRAASVQDYTISENRRNVIIFLSQALPEPGTYQVTFGFAGRIGAETAKVVYIEPDYRLHLKNSPIENIISIKLDDEEVGQGALLHRHNGDVTFPEDFNIMEGTEVEVTYWLGPIQVEIDGASHHLGWVDGSAKDGALYRVRLSAGLNLANDPAGVSGVVYCPSLASRSTDPDKPRDLKQNYLAYNFLATAASGVEEKKASAGGPVVLGSGFERGGVTEEIVPFYLDRVEVARRIQNVRGVYDNPGLTGTNYYTGGGFYNPEDLLSGGIIFLGTNLPQALPYAQVWVRYTPSDAAPCFGGVGGHDYLHWRLLGANPWIRSNPLWPELAPEFPAPRPSDYGSSNYVEPSPYDPTAPNEGAGNTAYVFQVRYYNNADLSPLPWLPAEASPANYNRRGIYTGPFNSPSGVVLFLDVLGTGDYKPYFMQKADPSDTSYTFEGGGCEYIYRIEPSAGWSSWYSGSDLKDVPSPHWPSNNLYESLQLGRYHYYFACSDDYLNDEEDKYYGNTRRTDVGDSRWTQPHNVPYDPGNGGQYGWYDNRADNHSKVDARTSVPGPFTTGFEYSADRHPVVNPSLAGLNSNALYTNYPMFMETLSPLYDMANPVYAYPVHQHEVGQHLHAGQARSSGGTTSTVYTFSVLYKSKNPGTDQGIAPSYVKLFINNASDYGTAEERANPADPHYYREYAMSIAPGQPQLPNGKYDYAKGVKYSVTLGAGELPIGPHSYYFEAHDGIRRARLPVRPDGRLLKSPDGSQWRFYEDPFVPGAGAVNDNDYFPGPYINSAPIINNPRVTPTSGSQGTNFKFEATYMDPDGQRPLYIDVLIQTRDNGTEANGGVIRGRMSQVNPAARTYKTGVDFYFDLRSLSNVVLQPGIRRFKFEVQDDWGEPSSIFEKIPGEKVFYPQGGDNWLSGPLVEFERAPRLTNGGVTSSDGTSTTATLWNYSVRYTHANNTPPAYVNVYIGKRSGIPTQYVRERNRPLDLLRVKVHSTPVLTVTGVWANADGEGTNYYTGGSVDQNSGVIALGTALPPSGSTVKDVYVTYTADPIVWDAGRAMAKVNPANNDFAGGVDYLFQTRLAGPQDSGSQGFRYVYAFQASDGTRAAVYNPVVDPVGTELSRRAHSPSAYAVIGQAEPYVDANGNGVWDPGETYIDQNGNGLYDYGPEPFVDEDGSGLYEVGEPFTDLNGNGVYDIGGEKLTQNVIFTKYSFANPIVCGPLPLAEPLGPGVIDGPRIFKNGELLTPDTRQQGVTYVASDRKTVYVEGKVSRVISVKSTSPVNPDYDYYGTSPDSWCEYYDAWGWTYIRLGGDPIPSGAYPIVDVIIEGDYSMDYVKGVAVFHQANQQSDFIAANYWFSAEQPQAVTFNKPPTLTLGSANPYPVGGPNDNFVFRVTYTDTDGLYGQAPSYVRVYIDDMAYNMTRVNTGTPNFRDGERYGYTTKLTGGAHRFRFAASDGSGYAVFDKNGGRSSSEAIISVEDIPGPYVNGDPLLRMGRVEPSPTVPVGHAITYSVIYTDEEPDDKLKSGYPKAWIDNPDETAGQSRTVGAIDAATSTITVSGSPGWQEDALVGKLIQFTSGEALYSVYVVIANAGNTLTLIPNAVVDDGIVLGDTFNIGSGASQCGLTMMKRLPSQSSYRTQTLQVTGPDISADGLTVTVSPLVVSGVLGVYLTQSPGPTDINYFTNGSYDFDTGIITLGIRLPDVDGDGVVDATSVYVQHGMAFSLVVPALPEGLHTYHFSAVSIATIGGVEVESSARLPLDTAVPTEFVGPTVQLITPPGNVPPVLASGSVTPTSGISTQLFVFKVNYSDADNDPPHVHDGIIQGYARVHIDLANGATLVKDLSGEASDWTNPVQLVSEPLPLPFGTHRFHFEAADGWPATGIVRFPAFSISDPTVVVNSKPTLSSPSLTPATGNDGSTFNFSVVYTDLNDVPPATGGYVRVRIDGSGGLDYPMTRKSGAYRTGATYTVSLSAGQLPLLTGGTRYGTHNYQFLGHDGFEAATSTTVGTGPTLLDVPYFLNPSVDPTTGDVDTTFTYRVRYMDRQGVAPTKVQLIVDDKVAGDMVKEVPSDNDSSDGIDYRMSLKLGDSGLHTYDFLALPSNTRLDAPISNPTIEARLIVTPSKSPASLGDVIDITLELVPARVAPVKLTIKRPDQSVVYDGTVQTAANGKYTYSGLELTNSGAWAVTAHWVGNPPLNPAITEHATISVSGPTHTISMVHDSLGRLVGKIDMVCPPVAVTGGDPANLFMKYPDSQSGNIWIADRLHIARWTPAFGEYLFYGSNPGFPVLGPGMAFFIKPRDKFWSGGNNYLLQAFGALPNQTQHASLPLQRGWNQFGSIFTSPVKWSDVKVSYEGKVITLTEAGKAGYIRDYAWGWNTRWEPYIDANGNGIYDQGELFTDWNGNGIYDGPAYFLLHASYSTPGVRRTLEPWIGYWIRVMVDGLQLVIPSPGSTGTSAPMGMMMLDDGPADSFKLDVADYPPPIVFPD